MNLQNRKRLTDLENEIMITRGEGWGMRRRKKKKEPETASPSHNLKNIYNMPQPTMSPWTLDHIGIN